MKKVLAIVFSLTTLFASAQETSLLFKEADNLERQQKEPEALDKYKQILVAEPANIKALVKATELTCYISARATNKNDKRLGFESALAYAQRAVKADTTSADAWYAVSVASGKMVEVETENKKIAGYLRDTKTDADKAVALNPKHARANFMIGKWFYDMTVMPGAKRTAIKLLYGGLPEISLDSAFIYLEKSKTYDPYFVLNQSILAKAYRLDNKPAKEMEILTRLVKLPTRTFDDIALKDEGQKRLQELQ